MFIDLCRPTKADKNSEELLAADRHVEKYKEVLDKICRKFLQNPSSSSSSTNSINIDQDAREKRCRKVHEYKLAQAIEESLKDLPDGLLRDVLENCGNYGICFSSPLYCIVDVNFVKRDTFSRAHVFFIK